MRERWFERSFSFDFPVTRVDAILDRLRGAPDRAEAKLRGFSAAARTRRPGESWSAQEHVGHLIDLERLHLRRLEDFDAGVSTLASADLENRATWEARHNERSLDETLAALRATRADLLERLESMDDSRLSRTALHPRLKVPMRVVDMAYFVAEHDDYHLARAHEVLRADAGPAAPARVFAWAELASDVPMPLLSRKRIIGEQAMLSEVALEAGCVVPVHAHANEQFVCMLRGVARFSLEGGDTRTVRAGEVLHLPANAPHGVEILENALILDVFAPPSATTGIDRR